MSDFIFVTPVAFFIFNRPDVTKRVFEKIAKIKPPKLLVVADGPRLNRQGEAEKVAATRAIIQLVDWECELLTNFADVNLGCKNRVSSGIDWVFEQVEEAIILEDDCLPDLTFFRYCQQMLEQYRNDQRIGMISGDNFQFGRRYGDSSYYFSKFFHIWGWATWRDRWVGSYDVTMAKWPRVRDEGLLSDMVGSRKETVYWSNFFEQVYNEEIDTWDYQWVFANWVNGRLSIVPAVNLISNIGFGLNATHTVGVSKLANLPLTPIKFPLSDPIGVFKNHRADRYSEKMYFSIPLWKRIRNLIVRQIR